MTSGNLINNKIIFYEVYRKQCVLTSLCEFSCNIFNHFFILIDSSTILASRQKLSLAQAFLLGGYVSLTATNLLQGCISHPLTPPTPGCPRGPRGSGGSFSTSPMTPRNAQSLYLLSLSKQQLHLGGQQSYEGWGNQLQPPTTTSNWPSLLLPTKRGCSASVRDVLVLRTTRDRGWYKISPHIPVYVKYTSR